MAVPYEIRSHPEIYGLKMENRLQPLEVMDQEWTKVHDRIVKDLVRPIMRSVIAEHIEKDHPRKGMTLHGE
jgi:hypothetical protein